MELPGEHPGGEGRRVDTYARAIERIHAHGISVQAGIVFGFDHDTESVFDETLDFLEATGVQNATFNILTPFPGTRLHDRLAAEGRILTRDWSKYNGRAHVVFQPRHMSPEALLSGYRYANRRFYSWRSAWRRPSRSPVGLAWTLPLNVAYVFALRSWRSPVRGEVGNGPKEVERAAAVTVQEGVAALRVESCREVITGE